MRLRLFGICQDRHDPSGKLDTALNLCYTMHVKAEKKEKCSFMKFGCALPADLFGDAPGENTLALCESFGGKDVLLRFCLPTVQPKSVLPRSNSAASFQDSSPHMYSGTFSGL